MLMLVDEEAITDAKPTKSALLVCEGRCSRDVLRPTRHTLVEFAARLGADSVAYAKMHYRCSPCGHRRTWGTWMGPAPRLDAAA